MKLNKKICIPICIVILLTLLTPVISFAGVSGGNVNMVSSWLFGLTSSNPTQGWVWGVTPTEPYTATLSPGLTFDLPVDITVQRVRDYSMKEIEKMIEDEDEYIYDRAIEQIYVEGVNYTYDKITGEIVIPVETLLDIAYLGSVYNIEIVASADFGSAYVAQATGFAIYTKLANLTSTMPLIASLFGSITDPFTATLSADTGYSLPSSIKVYKTETVDLGAGQTTFPKTIAQVYTAGSDYTYNASTGEIVIPVSTLSEISYVESPYNILILAAGIGNETSYTITVTQGANGTISPALAEDIPEGSDFTFSIAPDTGFRIADVLVDNISAGKVSSYTFTDIDSNHTITAVFEKIPKTPASSDNSPPTEKPLNKSPQTKDKHNIIILFVLLIFAGSIFRIVLRSKKSRQR